MHQRIKLLILFVGYFLLLLVIPAFIVSPKEEIKTPLPEEESTESTESTEAPSAKLTVPVMRQVSGEIEPVELEEYVVGVVASEMPASFEKEALKAQALAARTYVTKFLSHSGEEPITDSTAHQVYKSREELKEIWKDEFPWKIKAIEEAVNETKGEILTYEGRPITAAFFSTSNGWTENAKDYWEEDVPYLASVESKWDEQAAPGFHHEASMPIIEFEEKLGIDLKEGEQGSILERTPGNRIKTVEIAGKTFSGREIREALDLRSTDFEWVQQGESVIIKTKGYGHGVGMSQYGANGMALAGSTYKEIVHHYFKGVELATIDQAVPALLVKR
ncbi:stage II sporulation protein D [Jeotgalibacillus salarius]|uniref:Stage II sporulation protein D n=1 Tax=Jeotgalibacillus salarius TaxID=546023 RepID=A0A4Y8LQ11_9BACL|nr:stage II sporulation protein D [Jeotgalibacillus salarius]TFE04101.1 stage II sporulation protein D [Jeotgalibacillus salarius]